MKSYSFGRVSVTVDGIPVVGFAEGDDVVQVTPAGDDGSLVIGADGQSVFLQTVNDSAEIVLKLLPTSSMNKILQARYTAQKAGVLFPLGITIVDPSANEVTICVSCNVIQSPVRGYGAGVGVREWKLVAESYTTEVG